MTFRRFVNLVSRDSLKSVYYLRRMDMSRLFLPTLSNNGSGGRSPMDDDGCSCSLPEPTINFYSSEHRGDCGGDMEFMLVDNKVVSADIITGDTLIYDPDEHAVRPLPSREAKLKKFAVSHTFGDRLYVIDRRTNGTGTRAFEKLVYTDPSPASLHGSWHWHSLPPPPPPPGVQASAHDPTSIESFAVVAGGSRMWVSARGGGGVKSCTHLFDTEKLMWSKQPVEWALPFRGGAEYVHELGKLWFGISSKEHGSVFCASDLSVASESRPPVLHAVLDDDMAGVPEDWCLMSGHAVHLGSGKFCVARIFCICNQTIEDGNIHGDGEEFVVLAGVEVDSSDDGGKLTMVEHRSERYKLCEDAEIHWVI